MFSCEGFSLKHAHVLPADDILILMYLLSGVLGGLLASIDLVHKKVAASFG